MSKNKNYNNATVNVEKSEEEDVTMAQTAEKTALTTTDQGGEEMAPKKGVIEKGKELLSNGVGFVKKNGKVILVTAGVTAAAVVGGLFMYGKNKVNQEDSDDDDVIDSYYEDDDLDDETLDTEVDSEI